MSQRATKQKKHSSRKGTRRSFYRFCHSLLNVEAAYNTDKKDKKTVGDLQNITKLSDKVNWQNWRTCWCWRNLWKCQCRYWISWCTSKFSPAVPVDGAKDDGYTHNTPAYTVKIDRYILIIPVKTISRHGGQSTRRLMNRIPEKLHCFLKNFLSTTKRSVRVTNYSIWNWKENQNNCFRRKFTLTGGHDLS